MSYLQAAIPTIILILVNTGYTAGHQMTLSRTAGHREPSSLHFESNPMHTGLRSTDLRFDFIENNLGSESKIESEDTSGTGNHSFGRNEQKRENSIKFPEKTESV
jgi:hypothetical protein